VKYQHVVLRLKCRGLQRMIGHLSETLNKDDPTNPVKDKVEESKVWSHMATVCQRRKQSVKGEN